PGQMFAVIEVTPRPRRNGPVPGFANERCPGWRNDFDVERSFSPLGWRSGRVTIPMVAGGCLKALQFHRRHVRVCHARGAGVLDAIVLPYPAPPSWHCHQRTKDQVPSEATGAWW